MQPNIPEKLLQRPHPEPGESLTGYLMRLATENFTDVRAITQGLRKRRSMERSYSWDLFGPDTPGLAELSGLSDVPKVDLQALTLYPIWDKFGMDPRSSRSTSGFVSMSFIKTHRRFCPICLQKNGILQLLWNIDELRVCPTHRVLLQESCASCGGSQPYMSPSLMKFRCINGCANMFPYAPEIVVDNNLISEQKERWNQWNTLLHSVGKLINPIDSYDAQQSVTVVTLYLISALPEMSRKNVDFFQRFKNSLKVDAPNNSKRGIVPPLRKLLQVCRELQTPISRLPTIRVPNGFMESLQRDPRSKFICMVPWCSCYGRHEQMIRSPSKVKQYRHVKYSYYSMCTECSIEYGIDSRDGEWKIIKDDAMLWIQKIRDMLLSGTARYHIYTTMKVTRNDVDRYVGYLAYHKLLPKDLLSQFAPRNPITRGLVKKFKTLSLEASKRGFQTDNWYRCSDEFNRTQYFYYLADKNVRIFLFSEFKYAYNANPSPDFQNKKISENFRDDVMRAIQRLMQDEVRLSLVSVGRELGVSAAVISNHKHGDLVKKWKDIQRRQNEQQLVASAYHFKSIRDVEGKSVRLTDFCIEQGINPRTVRKIHPEVVDVLKGNVQYQIAEAWTEAAATISGGDHDGGQAKN